MESLSAVIFELCSEEGGLGKNAKSCEIGWEFWLPPPPYPEQPHFDFFHFRIAQSGKNRKENQRTVIKSTGSGLRRLSSCAFGHRLGGAWWPWCFLAPAIILLPSCFLARTSSHLSAPLGCWGLVTELLVSHPCLPLSPPPLSRGSRWAAGPLLKVSLPLFPAVPLTPPFLGSK